MRRAISQANLADEAACVRALLDGAPIAAARRAKIRDHARALVIGVRLRRAGASGVDHLMREFSLASDEGVALMCLAEAMLRIPDAATRDRLIRDKIGRGDWAAHLWHSPSLFVNAASWGLLITGKLVGTASAAGLGGALTRLIARGGEPLIRRAVDLAMRLLGRQFVTGETIAAALEHSREPAARGYRFSYDMLGEAALTAGDALRYLDAYANAIAAIGKAGGGRGVYAGPGISVKLSALHPRYCRAQRERVIGELLPRLKQLMLLARSHDIGFNIDAEEAERLDLSLDLLDLLAFDPALAGWQGMGFVVQAYQKRCPLVIEHLVDLARRSGRRLMIRLVKGAYWDSEIKRAQVNGLEGYPVYTRKSHTDVAYLACAAQLIAAADAVYPQFATHNAQTLASVVQMAGDAGVTHFEFQCLHGMGEPLYDQIVDSGVPACRIYAPVGSHATLLPYLVRRLLENGANSSFVNRIVDDSVGIEELIEDPVGQVVRAGASAHPRIPLPRDLYGAARVNSSGLDLSDEATLATLAGALRDLEAKTWGARGAGEPVRNPANRQAVVGWVVAATPEQVDAALAIATGFATTWEQAGVATRAAALERAGDLFERHRNELISLAMREAGKTLAGAASEVREAVDFCRYYAQQARLQFAGVAPAPIGPVTCISPWNFPLAIFTGQVAAALVAGNPVLAKPAEQTPLIAGFAVELMHRAGIPRAALQLLPGAGETVGAALTADPRVRGVIFTGSTEVARIIQRALAARAGDAEVVLIAETGGQNAMIVDSSALPEQVVQDVISSAFDNAGQRCSALRVLCVQNELAHRLPSMLREAMRELVIGDPALLATDIGPVIDDQARAAIEAHIARMRAAGKPVFQLPLPPACAAGSFVAPAIIEIDSIAELEREVFGPVLHVLHFDRADLDGLIDAINATGYALTLGVHSRIDETIDRVIDRARAGNVYVNRNMIGAVVGVQPFGGKGRSGTGPKAGGPLYLQRLVCGAAPDPATWGCEVVRTGAPRPALDALAQWAASSGRLDLAERCARFGATSIAGTRVTFAGPTGETNTLRFVGRGTLGCVADSGDRLLVQIAAALATGNDAALEPSPMAHEVRSLLPQALLARVRLAGDWMTEDISLLLATGPRAQHMRVILAARDGALVSVITPEADGGYPLHRLVTERAVSVNTTAAGGNASLMTLGG